MNKSGVMQEKMGIWPQKSYFNEVLGVKCQLLCLKCWYFCQGGCDKFNNEPRQRKKSGCHGRINGHLTPKTHFFTFNINFFLGKNDKFNMKVKSSSKNNGCFTWKNGQSTPKTQFWWGFEGQMPIFLPKMLIHLPGEMANSITVPVREKKMGVTHEKMGVWPQKPYFSEVLGVKCPLFRLECWFFFQGKWQIQ